MAERRLVPATARRSAHRHGTEGSPGQLADAYDQDSIAWTEGETRFIGPLPIVHISPGCACGINEAGLRYVDPLCRDGS
jgi:hypothetical protein